MEAWEQIAALRREGIDAVVVTIAAVRGSVPGQVGSKAVITAAGQVSGNLGGGKVEAKAIQHAIAMLGQGGGPNLTPTQEVIQQSLEDANHRPDTLSEEVQPEPSTPSPEPLDPPAPAESLPEESCNLVVWNLQRDVGMTCGGEMTFLFERVVSNEPWHIAIFGAGHVSQALVPILTTLACKIDVFDTRADWLSRLPQSDKVVHHLVPSFETGVWFLSPQTFVVSITQGHSSDRPVLREALRRFPEIPFLGVIGSLSKKAVLLRELREDGIPEELLERIICPLGLPIGTNDPAEIAISISAQLLEKRR